VRDDLLRLAAVVSALAVLGTVIWFFLGPGWDRLFTRTYAENVDTILAALLRRLKQDDNEATRELLRKSVELVFPERMKLVDELKTQVATNKDDLEYVKAAIQQQGVALTRELTTAVEHIADIGESTKSMLERMERRQEERGERVEKRLQEHGEQMARMDERIKAWDGVDRRRGDRRHGED
jgi:hypothetical protein